MLNDDQKLKTALQTYLEESDGITVSMPSEVVHALLSRARSEAVAAPIDMVLLCPKCNFQHIDAPDEPGTAMAGIPRWTNPPHRSHQCHSCGHVWRPADVETNGVAAVNTKGKRDSAIVASVDRAAAAVPAAIWKTTHKAVCVPITEDKEVADQWKANGYEVIAYSTNPAPQAALRMTRQALYDLIHGMLMEHGLSYTCDASDEKYPLVDKLSAPGDSTTKTGKDEVAFLAEAVLDVLPTTVTVSNPVAEAPQLAPQRPTDPMRDEPAFWLNASEVAWLARTPGVGASIHVHREGGGSKVPAYFSAQCGQRAGESEEIAEGIEIIDNLIDSVTAHGNYSPEATISFLSQARQCFKSASQSSAKAPTGGERTIDEQAAVKFYRDNPSVALVDLKQRLHGVAPQRAEPVAAAPCDWDLDAAIEALQDFPKGSIWYEFLELLGTDPTSGPVYRLTVQGRAMLDQLKSAYFPVVGAQELEEAARYRAIKPYLRIEDVGDEEFVFGLRVAGDSLEEDVSRLITWKRRDEASVDAAINALTAVSKPQAPEQAANAAIMEKNAC